MIFTIFKTPYIIPRCSLSLSFWVFYNMGSQFHEQKRSKWLAGKLSKGKPDNVEKYKASDLVVIRYHYIALKDTNQNSNVVYSSLLPGTLHQFASNPFSGKWLRFLDFKIVTITRFPMEHHTAKRPKSFFDTFHT